MKLIKTKPLRITRLEELEIGFELRGHKWKLGELTNRWRQGPLQRLEVALITWRINHLETILREAKREEKEGNDEEGINMAKRIELTECDDYRRHEVFCDHLLPAAGRRFKWRTQDGCSENACLACLSEFKIRDWPDLIELAEVDADGIPFDRNFWTQADGIGHVIRSFNPNLSKVGKIARFKKEG